MTSGHPAPKIKWAFVLLVFTTFLAIYAPRLAPSVLNDPDTSWHIATGQWIIKHARIPLTDPWSFTAGNTPWYNLSWAFDVPLAWLYDAGGFNALAVTAILSYTGLIAWTGWRCLRDSTPLAAFASVLICGNLLTAGVTMRPYIVSLYILMAFLELLRRAEEKPEHRHTLLWQLPLLMMAWVNFHGAFLLGFILLGMHGIAALLENNTKWFTILCWLASLCLLASLINPMGEALYWGAWRTLSGALPDVIIEWKPPVLRANEGLTWLVMLFIMCFHHRHSKRPLSETLLVLVWFVLALSSKRYILFAAIALAPTLSAMLHASLSESRFRNWYQQSEKELSYLLTHSQALPALRALALAVIVSLAIATALIWPNGISLSQSDAPVKEMEYAATHYPGARVLNFYDYGSYMLLAAPDQLRPFIDGRAETAYPDSVTHDYIRFQRQTKGWDAIPEKYRADLILVPKNWVGRLALDRLAGWQWVHSDRYGALYARR